MASIEIPRYLRYDCLRCEQCCRRGWPIGLAHADYDRLKTRDWGQLDPQLADRRLFVVEGHRARTALCDDGSCVFLDEDNLCIIHKRLGYQTKPLGCRLYPFTITRTPSGNYVGVRFSCRAVAQLHGRQLTDHRKELSSFCKELFPSREPTDPRSPVAFSSRAPSVPWSDILTVDRAIDEILGYTELTLGQRILLLERVVDQLAQADMSKLTGAALSELLELIVPAFAQEVLADDPVQLMSIERRLITQFFGRVHTQVPPEFLASSRLSRLRTRWRLFRQQARFVSLKGEIGWSQLEGPVQVRDVWEAGSFPMSESALDLLLTYLKVKLFSKSGLGEPLGACPFLYAIRLNVAFLVAVAWFARARALSRGAGEVEQVDVSAALEHVDAAYVSRGEAGSPMALGQKLARRHGDAVARAAATLVDQG